MEWGALQAHVGQLQRSGSGIGTTSKSPHEQLATLLRLQTPSSNNGLPDAILSGAPHLARLAQPIGDSHLDETWRLRYLFASEKAVDSVIDVVQRQQLDEPMPRSVWKDIVLDWFVNFEKLFAVMEPGYDHQDMPKDFFGELALVKKEHARAKNAVVSESDWG